MATLSATAHHTVCCVLSSHCTVRLEKSEGAVFTKPISMEEGEVEIVCMPYIQCVYKYCGYIHQFHRRKCWSHVPAHADTCEMYIHVYMSMSVSVFAVQ